MPYYNTTAYAGEDLAKRSVKAHSQDIDIYQVFLSNPDDIYCPSEIHQLACKSAPITSVRRSISTLSDEANAFLIKTETTALSEYNKYKHHEYCWKLNPEKKWDMVTPLVKSRKVNSKGLPNDIDMALLKKILKYSDRYEISIQFWPNLLAVDIAKNDVELASFDNLISALEYLNRITKKIKL